MICPSSNKNRKERGTKLDLCPEFSLAHKLETESLFMFCEREASSPPSRQVKTHLCFLCVIQHI